MKDVIDRLSSNYEALLVASLVCSAKGIEATAKALADEAEKTHDMIHTLQEKVAVDVAEDILK